MPESELPPLMCPHCSTYLKVGDSFCPGCGKGVFDGNLISSLRKAIEAAHSVIHLYERKRANDDRLPRALKAITDWIQNPTWANANGLWEYGEDVQQAVLDIAEEGDQKWEEFNEAVSCFENPEDPSVLNFIKEFFFFVAAKFAAIAVKSAYQAVSPAPLMSAVLNLCDKELQKLLISAITANVQTAIELADLANLTIDIACHPSFDGLDIISERQGNAALSIITSEEQMDITLARLNRDYDMNKIRNESKRLAK